MVTTMRKGDSRRITVDGRAFNAAYLGKGFFCSGAFREFIGDELTPTGRVFLFIRDHDNSELSDFSKEALSMWCNKLPHIPEVERHEPITTVGKEQCVYSMPYYRTLTATHALAWRQYKTLRTIRDDAWIAWDKQSKPLSQWGLYFAEHVIELATGKVPESITAALTEMLNAMSNYGSGYSLEFTLRNLGVDADGCLVFRDIWFNAGAIYRMMEAKRRRAGLNW